MDDPGAQCTNCLNYPYLGDGRSLGDHLPVVTLQKFTAEQELKRLGYSSTGKAINRVPFVVFAKWVTSHWHSAIVVKSVDRIERTTTSIFGAHQNAMRKFAIDQRT